MNTAKFGLLVAAVVALTLGGGAGARADEDEDHDLALELHEHGEILALVDILKMLSATIPGDVVGLDLIQVNGRWVYRVQVVADDGHRTSVDIDAGLGSVLADGGNGQ